MNNTVSLITKPEIRIINDDEIIPEFFAASYSHLHEGWFPKEPEVGCAFKVVGSAYKRIKRGKEVDRQFVS